MGPERQRSERQRSEGQGTSGSGSGRPTDGRLVVPWLAGIALSLGAIVIALVGLVLPTGDRVDSSTGAAEGGGSKTISVEMGEFYVDPPAIEVPAGTNVTLEVTNAGTMAHDLKLDGKKGTAMLDPGASETVELGVIDADGQAWCTVPGHKEAGMVMAITVTGGGDQSAAQASGGGDHPTMAAAGAVDGSDDGGDFATIDPQGEPGEDFVPYDPALAPAPGGTEHKVTMRATETVLEVAPGVTQEMWTFDDQVPGPTLRGRPGDLFTITLVNDGKMGHSIDFHASQVAWSDEMRTIGPGESLVYQFRAGHAGAFMYHCGTAPTLHHIGNGMYGAIIIDPPVLAPVAHEYLFVQSELYLGPEGQPGDLTKMQDEEWDAVVFNGYWSQYKFAPIQVEPGERIRVWVVDDGPSENSAFHVVGTVFDTVWKEGTYLLQPDARQGGSQVLDLQPAQGGFVEFSLAEVGYYPFVTHKFSNAGKGAMGLFRAGDAELPEGAGH